MASYLLRCDCGKTVPVEIGQAGGQVRCECGAQLDVPPLRALRQLPLAESTADTNRGQWSAANGAVAALLTVTVLLLAAATWSRLTEPPVREFDAAEHIRNMEGNVERLTPVQAWQVWVQAVRPLRDRGFFVIDLSLSAAEKEEIADAHFFQAMMLVVAAVFAAAAVVAFLVGRSSRPSARGA